MQSLLVATGLVFLLHGCASFTPLLASHDDRPGVAGELARIAIGPIPDRRGQLFRIYLQDQLIRDNREPGAYRLDANLRVNENNRLIRRDKTTIWLSVSMVADFTLRDRDRVVFRSSERVEDSFPGLRGADDAFSQSVYREDVERRLLKALAKEVVRRLGLFFYARQEGGR